MKKLFYSCLIIFSFFISCEDPIPTDYISYNVIEALLIVNEPIRNIKILKTQSLFSEFTYDSSLVKDAKVYIIENDNVLELKYRYSDTLSKNGYFYPDTSYIIKKNTNYKIKILLSDSTLITGETITPDSIYWISSCKRYMQYPIDKINTSTNDSLEWNIIKIQPLSLTYYLLMVNCLDTLNYGIYLEPTVNELNKRIDFSIKYKDEYYRETNITMLVPTNKVPIIWKYLKWFGLHEISVWLPDNNYRRWSMQLLMANNLDEKFSSVKGAIGFFGSAFVIRDTTVILKN